MSTLSTAERLEEAFCAALDEQGPVVIAGIEFDRSAILREMDPIAYDTELANFFDAEGFDPDEDREYDDSMDGDFDSGMASAGFGMDEDY